MAIRALTERHAPRIHAFVASLIGGGADAEDLTQDVFLGVFAALSSFDPSRGRFSAWIYAIARNRCRRLGRRKVLQPDPPTPVDGRTPERAAMERELHARLDAALQALPWKLRVAFVLAEVEEVPYQEIATIEGVPLGTVKSRVHRARVRLRSHLGEEA